MTNFNRDDFNYHGGYLTYKGEQGTMTKYYGENGESCHPTRKGLPKDAFIARFKYATTSSKGPWITFLCKHFTVEEYLGRMAAGETPLAIMESKGFVLSHIKKWLKQDGYPQTQEGYRQWREARDGA
jgi:hypothetical protein